MNRKCTLRKDGRYTITLPLSTGKKFVYGSSMEECIKNATYLEWLDKSSMPSHKYSFGVVYVRWFSLKMKEVKPQTADRIEVTYNKYFKDSDIVYKDMRKIDNLYVVDFIVDILDKYSITKKEYGRILQILVGVYDFCIDFLRLKDCLNWERIKKNIPKSKFVVNEKNEVAISDDVVTLFSDLFLNNPDCVNKPCATALLFCNFFIGLRIGELACLEWSLIDFDKKVVYIRHTETKYHARDEHGNRLGYMMYCRDGSTKTLHGVRTVPLCDVAILILKWIQEYQQSKGYETNYVAYDGNDVVMVRSLDRTLRKICNELKIDEINSHLLRKTLATRLHYNGVPTKEIAKLLGHSDISTTERNYILYMDDNYDSIRDNISNVYAV